MGTQGALSKLATKSWQATLMELAGGSTELIIASRPSEHMHLGNTASLAPALS